MKVKEIPNFYFFRDFGSVLYLLVGTANLPDNPAPVKKRTRYGDYIDHDATSHKANRVKTKFLAKNNAYHVSKGSRQITGKAVGDPISNLGLRRVVDPKTKSTTPLFIGKKKTGPGSYFFYRQSLFLAESKEDVINHINPEDSQANPNNSGRERISDETQIFVWNRDGGSCVKCGSQENLAFDHIIPHSLGGSNSRRNLQLLCDTCNLKKSNKIGG